MGGDSMGRKHCCFLSWKSCALEGVWERRQQEIIAREQHSLQKFLSDERQQHELEIHKLTSEAEGRHEEMQSIIRYALAKWDMGDIKGLLDSVFKNWFSIVKEI